MAENTTYKAYRYNICFSIEVLLTHCLQTNIHEELKKKKIISKSLQKSYCWSAHVDHLWIGWINSFQQLKPQLLTYSHHFSRYQLQNYMLNLCYLHRSQLKTTGLHKKLHSPQQRPDLADFLFLLIYAKVYFHQHFKRKVHVGY